MTENRMDRAANKSKSWCVVQKMIARNYILATIMLASIPFLSQISLAESGDSEGPKPELTHPELYKLHLIKETLKCGDAELMAESACFNTTDNPDTQCRKQTIRLVNSQKGISKNLHLDGKLVKKNFKESPGPVLDTVVVAWDCLKSQSGESYIYLWYMCNWGRDCYGTHREWQRLFDVYGNNLTLGFKKHDKIESYERLYKKLGISENNLHLKYF
jgi:hypothetical protein